MANRVNSTDNLRGHTDTQALCTESRVNSGVAGCQGGAKHPLDCRRGFIAEDRVSEALLEQDWLKLHSFAYSYSRRAAQAQGGPSTNEAEGTGTKEFGLEVD